MRDPTEDDRVLFVAAFSLVVLMLWQLVSELSNPIFWAVVVLWALILLTGLRVKKRVLKADTWAMSVELGTFSRRTALMFFPLVGILILSPLVPLFIGIRVRGFESIRYSGFVGGLVGLDFSIAHGWLRRRNRNK